MMHTTSRELLRSSIYIYHDAHHLQGAPQISKAHLRDASLLYVTCRELCLPW